MHVCSVIQLYLTLCGPMDCARQVPLSMGFSRQEHWSEFLFSTPGHSPDPGTEPGFLLSPALTGKFFTLATKLIKMIVNYKTIGQREINNTHSTSNYWLHLKLQSNKVATATKIRQPQKP